MTIMEGLVFKGTSIQTASATNHEIPTSSNSCTQRWEHVTALIMINTSQWLMIETEEKNVARLSIIKERGSQRLRNKWLIGCLFAWLFFCIRG